MHYLDTCICVEFLRGRLREGYQEMRRLGRPEFKLPAIVVAELYFGAEHSANPKRELGIVEQFASAFDIVPFDAASAREYGRIRQELGSRGQIIGDRDMMIAATALANKAVLVTRNVNEFKRVQGLELETWDDIEY